MQIDDYQLRPVVPPGQPRGFPGQAAADDHHGAVLLVSPAGVSREQPLVRRPQAIDDARDPPLPAVGVSGQHQVKTILVVDVQQFRAVLSMSTMLGWKPSSARQAS